MEQMNIRLLQSPTVEKKGEEILFPYKKAAGLFYYLCVKKSATREELIHLLWADGSEASGRKSLREALYQIKKKVGEDFLLLSGQSSVRLNPEVPCFVDLDHPEDILEHYKGGFLDHFYVKNCYEFEEWAQETREYYRNCYLEEVRRRLDLAARWMPILRFCSGRTLIMRRSTSRPWVFLRSRESTAWRSSSTMI